MSKHEYEGMEAYERGKEVGAEEALHMVASRIKDLTVYDTTIADPDTSIAKMVASCAAMTDIVREVTAELSEGWHHDK